MVALVVFGLLIWALPGQKKTYIVGGKTFVVADSKSLKAASQRFPNDQKKLTRESCGVKEGVRKFVCRLVQKKLPSIPLVSFFLQNPDVFTLFMATETPDFVPRIGTTEFTDVVAVLARPRRSATSGLLEALRVLPDPIKGVRELIGADYSGISAESVEELVNIVARQDEKILRETLCSDGRGILSPMENIPFRTLCIIGYIDGLKHPAMMFKDLPSFAQAWLRVHLENDAIEGEVSQLLENLLLRIVTTSYIAPEDLYEDIVKVNAAKLRRQFPQLSDSFDDLKALHFKLNEETPVSD